MAIAASSSAWARASRERVVKRWVVRSAASIEEVVRLAGADDAAIDDGRVFVGRVRAKRGVKVAVGAEVTVHAPPAAIGSIEVLRASAELVVVAKPAGIPTIPDHAGAAHSLLAAAAREVGCAPAALHPTSRLDRDVSGVVIFARTAQTAEALLAARAEGAYYRRYVALAKGVLSPEARAEGRWDAPIGRAKEPRLRAAFGRDAKPSATRHRTIEAKGAGERAWSWLECEPETGRTHQIRVHASHAGVPLLGDGEYGGPKRVTLASGKSETLRRIYLHCQIVEVSLGGRKERFEVRVPEGFGELWAALG